MAKLLGHDIGIMRRLAENASYGGVTSFDMACKREVDIMVSELN